MVCTMRRRLVLVGARQDLPIHHDGRIAAFGLRRRMTSEWIRRTMTDSFARSRGTLMLRNSLLAPALLVFFSLGGCSQQAASGPEAATTAAVPASAPEPAVVAAADESTNAAYAEKHLDQYAEVH